MENEVFLQGAMWRRRSAVERSNKGDMCSPWNDCYKRKHPFQSCPCTCKSTKSLVSVKNGSVSERPHSIALPKEFSELRKRYWGCHLWGRGYFCSTVGAVTEDIIKKYIENQNNEDSAFKILDEKKDLSSLGVSSDT
jgi:hypothetical protein